jgi:hypothetical protein
MQKQFESTQTLFETKFSEHLVGQNQNLNSHWLQMCS